MSNETIEFNYYFVGARSKPIVLFLHGFMGAGADFDRAVSSISEDYCCLLVDLPGHGKTEVSSDRDYLMSETAQGIVKLLGRLIIPRCFLIGYSMGGRLALYLTVYFPQFFQGVILESASPGLATQLERDKRIEQDRKLMNRLEQLDFTVFLEQWYGNPLFASLKHHPRYPQAIAKRLLNSPHKLAKSLRYMGLGMQPSLWKVLPQIEVPMLLVVGALDSKFIAINQQILALAPRFQLEIVDRCGHNVHFEHPFEFIQIVKDFLSPIVKK